MDWFNWDEISISLRNAVVIFSAGAMIVGGVIPYIPQYRQIKRTNDADGFSLHVCLTLLVANTLRILFWFGKHFEYPLLIQSLLMNCMMFLMVHLCVRVKTKNQVLQARQRIFTAKPNEVVRLLRSKPPRSSQTICDFDPSHFWNWSDFQSYLDCMLVFTIIASLLMYLFIEEEIFVETVGFLAVFSEAMLGSPQLLKNYQHKSTEGMSSKAFLRAERKMIYNSNSDNNSLDNIPITGNNTSTNVRPVNNHNGKVHLIQAEIHHEKLNSTVTNNLNSTQESVNLKGVIVDEVLHKSGEYENCEKHKKRLDIQCNVKGHAESKVSMLVHRHTL
ncbi:hypothetical protein FQA39_LY13733 [Lamprigera yunnana]|nr:hypothetical protein FQA39_LY13733 [Lamprigera yunnana]